MRNIMLLAVLALSCGASTNQLVQCQATVLAEALNHMPSNPDDITVGDVRDVAARLKTCSAGADAGLAH